MSQEAAPGPAESGVTSASIHPFSLSTSSASSSTTTSDDSFSFDDAFEAMVDEVLFDPMEDKIEARIVAQLFRGASPEVRRQVAAQQEALRAQKEALRRQVAESRAQTRRLKEYTALLRTDVSVYTEAQMEQYKRELDRRSKELFGK
ncbi:hypothetical protein BAE44_0023422 [Dichanthelium oligosanthes]|uniref:Uncharacterized protein n=1 Tax=Dichanthelium oligosanthes TaxID=888268 RepID=A0A1E5URN6_9POAL|nr:hypothetical protein BAE44_0023422 [Dichanthelium oligosanthes]